MFSKKVFFDELEKGNKSYHDVLTSSEPVENIFAKLPEEAVDF